MSIFVVHEHHARRLHWDLRLEMDGVLKSWAIPKPLPLEPGVKRLAIMVEDHPLEYANFEGEIPPGQYGAGKVLIWDRGEYELLERSQDKIIVYFHGNKLKGKYGLINFKKDGKHWLFFKIKD
ncbi:MAG: ATP-dependent DNA ligase [Candidatus Aenigmarchaeota archaeon]|nr:ATP-dependent DNA ligase [Candidatus Aenigmarchaeota archaeon]